MEGMNKIYVGIMAFILISLGVVLVCVSLQYKKHLKALEKIEKEQNALKLIKETYVITPQEDSIDKVYDEMRRKWQDSILLEDVKNTYGIESLEEYYDKHDSLLRGY